MEHSQLRSVILVCVVIVLLVGSFLAGRSFPVRRVIRAQNEPAPAAPEDPSYSSFYCADINNVAVFDNRIHLRCSTTNNVGSNSVRYYAYPTNSFASYTANRLLAVAQAAFALGKGAWIYYEASTSYNPPGCNTSDCRLVVGLSMVE